MSVLAPASQRIAKAHVPAPSTAVRGLPPKDDLTPREDQVLLARLEVFVRRWRRGEASKTATDRRGKKFFDSRMWDDDISPSRLAITSNLGLALFERAVSAITRGSPEPNVQSVNPDDEEGAMIISGALQTNWRETCMDQRAKAGARLCGFTRPIGWYVYWDETARGGIGDFNTITIPAHRLIVDTEHLRIADMKYRGFTRPQTRAELIQLFPDHEAEIMAAATQHISGSKAPEVLSDPLSDIPGTDGFPQVERLVANSSGVFTPVSSVRQGWGDRDILAQTIDVHYLWIDDPTPEKIEEPVADEHGRTKMEYERHPKTGEILFEEGELEMVHTVNGPFYQASRRPKTKITTRTKVVKKYPYSRHVVWIPGDRVKLWDVNWEGPVPVCIQRDTLPMWGFHAVGSAQRLCTLGVARNVLLTIIFERLKLSLSGAYLAEARSGLKGNKLVPEPGVVFQVQSLDGIKAMETNPVDAAYFGLLDRIENEMMKLIGISPVQMGQQAGRADSPATYESLIEQAGTVIVDRAQMLEQTITDWCEIGMWFIQSRYTHKHLIEIEYVDGESGWVAASSLATRGTFAVRVETGSTMAHSRSAELDEAKQAANLGIYAIPMLAKMGRIKNWKAALKQKAAIMADPGKSWLLGAAGAPPSQQSIAARQRGQRSHHRQGGGPGA